IKWEYRILWGMSANDLKHSVNMANTMNTSHIIRGLEACEVYILAVMVGGPIGIGPVEEKKITIGPDLLAPPKDLHATRVNPDNKTMIITWKPSCPRISNDSIRYELLIRDVIHNKTSYYELPSKVGNIQSHEVETHWGGRYSISIRSALPEARYSQPKICDGPVIPAPYELTFNPSDESFFWRRSPNMPNELLTQNISYILYISQNQNMSDAKLYPAIVPPIILSDLSPGVIYYASVVLQDADGYISPQSSAIRIEKPIGDEIVLSQNSVVGVAVSVFLVVVALIVVVGILAVRHRRLARSFLTFANTHYDRSQGTTLITTDHNL
ncbi:hypothetical protein SK128_017318, partial [Halocaridina rubra]